MLGRGGAESFIADTSTNDTLVSIVDPLRHPFSNAQDSHRVADIKFDSCVVGLRGTRVPD